jgi:D-cysteine desulfhydrase
MNLARFARRGGEPEPLDPVHTGKSMAGLIDQVRKGFFKKGENAFFVHTGGSPALYAYPDSFWE